MKALVLTDPRIAEAGIELWHVGSVVGIVADELHPNPFSAAVVGDKMQLFPERSALHKDFCTRLGLTAP